MRVLRPDLFSAKLFGCCIDVSEELLRAKRRYCTHACERVGNLSTPQYTVPTGAFCVRVGIPSIWDLLCMPRA